MNRSKILVKDLNLAKNKKLELVGICIKDNNTNFLFLDYSGEIEIYKNNELKFPEKRIKIYCTTFLKNKKIFLYCTGYKTIDLYESIFFTIESVNFNKHYIKNHKK
ncbi:hypothetical protein NCER_101202 [Vairimorpha ceranae BRL01]|uniref:Uncharacterized protein n=2 Tax=Vairimorpha ceranae TaxID=40302 RepID=C4V9G3_VAIC1|nr:hypothetical protein AAJ76_300041290 [Vairimorpha ceranae]EEQ82144.1 hypothetical protein NCER_101202 [Vairimorpha ceranae BRL01]KAF5140150.1 hypothetical protein G9O61_00g017040 [Vairimorpha ceranae]KKO76411.1 hypothetical protein AAJ76_300041290 [Vairimorpha ceranae]